MDNIRPLVYTCNKCGTHYQLGVSWQLKNLEVTCPKCLISQKVVLTDTDIIFKESENG